MHLQPVKTATKNIIHPQKNINTNNKNQQPTEQQRASPERNQDENNQGTIIAPGTEQDNATNEDRHF